MTFAGHRFESPDTRQTLAEGLAEYFAFNPMLKRDSDLLSTEARQFFRSHDAVHVVYGCGTTMSDEAIVKLVSIFGTTGGLKVLRGYLHHETLDIYRKLPVSETLVALVASPFLMVRTIWRCVSQSKRWPWAQFDQYLDVPLREVRAQFRIKVTPGRNAA
jgi:ubiquinone biosynthesis protein Coq4